MSEINDSERYPKLTSLGLHVVRGGDSPAGIDPDTLERVFRDRGWYEAWQRWGASGLTCGTNGFYPWDVESFLSGRVNDD